MDLTLNKIYEILLNEFGELSWWPIDKKYHEKNNSDPRFEIIIGAIIEIGDITGGLFKINAFIKNPGRIDANNINWSIVLNGGLILFGKETTGTVDIPLGENTTVNSKLIFGFGPISVTVTTNHIGTTETKKREGVLFLFLIYQLLFSYLPYVH